MTNSSNDGHSTGSAGFHADGRGCRVELAGVASTARSCRYRQGVPRTIGRGFLVAVQPQANQTLTFLLSA